MVFNVDPKVAPYYNVTFVLCALVFCYDCNREALYESQHPANSDKNYYDQALAMQAEGWLVLPDNLHVLCPACASKACGLAHPRGAGK